LAEAKDNVPCLKTPELVERVVLVDLCGVMIVVVVVEFRVMVGFLDPDRSH
jgi:multisubunit Na+/H+ antiporter MnhF subunit